MRTKTQLNAHDRIIQHSTRALSKSQGTIDYWSKELDRLVALKQERQDPAHEHHFARDGHIDQTIATMQRRIAVAQAEHDQALEEVAYLAANLA